MKIRLKGFTLIELLVVIAIIGILAAIAVASYSTMQKKARDTRRVSDMKAIQQGFEQSFGENQQYPALCTDISTVFLPSGLPVDPQTKEQYQLQSCSVGGYCFCAPLEVEVGNSETDLCGTSGTGTKFYCVNQLQ